MMKSIGFITALQFIAWVNCDGMQRMFFIVTGRVVNRYNKLAVLFSICVLPLMIKNARCMPFNHRF